MGSGELVLQLLNGAIRHVTFAISQLESGKYSNVHARILRAHDVVADLRNAPGLPSGVRGNLQAAYGYLGDALRNT